MYVRLVCNYFFLFRQYILLYDVYMYVAQRPRSMKDLPLILHTPGSEIRLHVAYIYIGLCVPLE